jgi:Pin2-interacting protein X1
MEASKSRGRVFPTGSAKSCGPTKNLNEVRTPASCMPSAETLSIIRNNGSRGAKKVCLVASYTETSCIEVSLTSRSRSKISNDPNNTHWSGDTTRFGQRMLAAQGWKPGDSLGASDAAHASHYTVASQSHIRVLLKDDNLGLGAKRGSERAENFGLAGLESILGRLNGKEAEVKKEEERREEIEKRAFVYRKYGMMNFVSGGFLVGDQIKPRNEIKKELEIKVEVKSEPESDSAMKDIKKKSKKRKDREESESSEDDTEEQPKLKRKKKSVDLRDQARGDVADLAKAKKDKKSKRDKKKSKKDKKTTTSDPEPMSSDELEAASDPEQLTDKAKRKAEKKARKEEKKLKKALKKAAKKAAKVKDDSESSSSESEDETPGTSTPATGTSTPTVTAAGLVFQPRGMHAVRQRYIRQKKNATMDMQAMREIFMIKTPVN